MPNLLCAGPVWIDKRSRSSINRIVARGSGLTIDGRLRPAILFTLRFMGCRGLYLYTVSKVPLRH